MDVAVATVLSGLSYGVVLFLIAAGLSFVLGLMGIVNLAHGVIMMTGAYIGITVAKSTGNLILGGLAGALLAGLVGLVIERGFLRKLYRLQLEQILVTFGFIYIITNIHLWIYGAFPLSSFIPASLSSSIIIGRYTFPFYRLVIILVGAVVCFLLYWVQERTKIGAIIRAGMDDPVITSTLGINLRPINIAAFCAGAMLAGIAGVFGAPVLGGVNLQVGSDIVFLAVAVVIVGGVGSIQGTLAGALLIGVGAAIAGTYLSVFTAFVPYLLMVVIMLFRPYGLFGKK